MKLSACLVIHNEEAILERCLTSVAKVADEIILVHDGKCKDKSLEIAEKFAALIYIREFIGEAEYHRPFAFSKAQGEWILHIDADEYLSEKLQKEIPKLIAYAKCDGYSFLWPYPDKKGQISKGPFSQTLKPSLFRKSKMYMIGVSHEYPRTYGKLCVKKDIKIYHHPLYDNFSLNLFKSKWIKWARLQARQLKNLNKIPVFNIENVNKNSAYTNLINIYDYPLKSGIIETVKFIFLYIYRGLPFAGLRSIKIAIFELMYIWALRINILKLKHE